MNKASLLATMKEDFGAFSNGVWPFTSYGFDKGQPSLMPGDLSPDELRWQAYQQLQKTPGNLTSHVLVHSHT